MAQRHFEGLVEQAYEEKGWYELTSVQLPKKQIITSKDNSKARKSRPINKVDGMSLQVYSLPYQAIEGHLERREE